MHPIVMRGPETRLFRHCMKICTTSCAPRLRSSLWNRRRPPAHRPVSACCVRLAGVSWTPGGASLEALPYTARCCAAHPCFSTLLFERAVNELATELLVEVACVEDLKLNRDKRGPSLLPDDPQPYIRHFLLSQVRPGDKDQRGAQSRANFELTQRSSELQAQGMLWASLQLRPSRVDHKQSRAQGRVQSCEKDCLVIKCKSRLASQGL